MIAIKTNIKGLIIFKGKKFKDKRGHFREILRENLIKKKFIFQITSTSKKNVIRGLHFQTKHPQGKFVSVLKGRIIDVCVDLRKKSTTFGKHFKIIISDKNCKSIYIPPGFAHGFRTLEKENIIVYSCTNYRHAKTESGIIWNDPTLKINWGTQNPIISRKDRENKNLKFFFK